MSDKPDESEKTEEPSQKKLTDAHKKGDVAKSHEVTTWFGIVAMTLAVFLVPESMMAGLTRALRGFIDQAHAIPMDGEHLRLMFLSLGGSVLMLLGMPFLLLIIGGVVGNTVQHRPVFSAEQMKPKASKISPLAGVKRLFSASSLVNFAKGIAKMVIIAIAMAVVVWPERERLVDTVSLDPAYILPIAKMMTIKMLAIVVIILGLIAMADFAFQQSKWHKKQRMTIKEVRDEHKQMEGDPAVRAKLRQIRVERGRHRMMQAVPKATVIVTNPTHYAVALKYEKGMAAPVCVAKGADRIALKIRQIATENDVPIVENPPLARALHATIEVNDQVPAEHYKAVAEVIGYVLSLKGRLARSPTVRQ
ncbi:Flagellar biosynthesis protein FlhB [hydrothermal vent metagenome]|uniref:Flagellar biosynthetic protein FlhB n=1 Tax=hydrothermal vent metagenome TaxID=652676 RepID=A0A3B0TDB9_9ZZZZ